MSPSFTDVTDALLYLHYSTEGRWNDQACGVQLAFICKRTEDVVDPITKAPTEPPTGNCPQGWYKLLTHCYRIYGTGESEWRSWDDARDQCQTAGSNLATIHNKEQQGKKEWAIRGGQRSNQGFCFVSMIRGRASGDHGAMPETSVKRLDPI